MARPRDPTQFTRESAERIANVVRAAELATPGARPLNFEREDFFRNAKIFRVATYTGAWSINASKTVTFKYQTATPNTATVLNLFFPVTSTAAGSRDCAIAKDGTGWFLVDVRFGSRTAVFAASTATRTVLGTGGTSVITFGTGAISAVLNTSACTISVTAQTSTGISVSMAGTQTFAVVQQTFTGTYLTLEV